MTWKLIEERICIIKKKSLSAKEPTKVAKDLQEQYRVKDKEVKRDARQDKRNYIDETAEESVAARVNKIKKLYNITKQLSGKSQLKQQHQSKI